MLAFARVPSKSCVARLTLYYHFTELFPVSESENIISCLLAFQPATPSILGLEPAQHMIERLPVHGIMSTNDTGEPPAVSPSFPISFLLTALLRCYTEHTGAFHASLETILSALNSNPDSLISLNVGFSRLPEFGSEWNSVRTGFRNLGPVRDLVIGGSQLLSPGALSRSLETVPPMLIIPNNPICTEFTMVWEGRIDIKRTYILFFHESFIPTRTPSPAIATGNTSSQGGA